MCSGGKVVGKYEYARDDQNNAKTHQKRKALGVILLLFYLSFWLDIRELFTQPFELLLTLFTVGYGS